MEKPNFTPNQKPSDNGGKKKFNFYWVYVILAVIFVIAIFAGGNRPDTNTKDIDKGKLIELLKNEKVAKIDLVNKEKAEVYLNEKGLASDYPDVKPNRKGTTNSPSYSYTIGSPEKFEDMVDQVQADKSNPVYINNIHRKSWATDFLIGWVPFIILIAVWVFIMRGFGRGGSGGQIFNIGKSKAQLYDKDTTNVNVTFKDVAGLEEAKEEVMEIVDFLKNPKRYTRLGGKIPKGVLLVGPPGTGKTLLAKSVAGEANVPFFSISGSDFVEMFVGVGASRVRDLFEQAKKKSPCIIFIDEIDAIGRARSKNPMNGGNDERESTLNQLLTEMDGFGTNSGVIVLAATNRADILDKALMRAGRFDRQIYVELPDLAGRKEIFDVHMRPLKKSDDITSEFLAKQTPGFSGADIANVCNEAALMAARHNKEMIEKQDFLDAIDRIVGGLEKKSTAITPSEKRVIAFHEAGHATTSWLLEHAHPLVKVTIVPRGRALGAAWYLPNERQITTKEQMFHEMISLMGGRAAEQIIFNQISTNALSDIERATKSAMAMVSYYGLNEKIGNVSYYDSTGQSEYALTKPFSEKTAEVIDEEVKKLVEEAYNKAIEILSEHREGLTQLAEKLIDKEVIFADNLEAIFGKRPWATEEAKPMHAREEKKEEDVNAEDEENKSEVTADNQEPNTNQA